MATPWQSSAQLPPPQQPQWHPYAFSGLSLLVVSTLAALKSGDGKQLDLGEKAAGTWTRELKFAHKLVRLGGCCLFCGPRKELTGPA